MHVEDPADLQDGGLGGSNLEHMHPTKQRVWVLLGGDGPQRTQSLQAGLHAYLRCGAWDGGCSGWRGWGQVGHLWAGWGWLLGFTACLGV